MTNIAEQLKQPFLPEEVEWRVSRSMKTNGGNKAIVLAYITNRAIMDRLDDVFGVGNWKNEYKEWRSNGILCGISARIEGEWVTKWDGSEETQIEAVKGGFSGSMKRAAVQWGIGRYLYDLDEVWVDVKDKGAFYINDKKSGVTGKWDAPHLPAWALPKQPEIKAEDVLRQWKQLGGTDEQFDQKIMKDWQIKRDELQQHQLRALKTLLDAKKAG